MEKIILSPNDAALRLDIFLCDFLKISRKNATKAIEEGFVLVDKKIKKPSYKLKGNEIIEYNPEFLLHKEEILPEDIGLDIKYEDEDLLVINKPKGMLTHPSAYQRENTLVNALLYHCNGKLSDADKPLRRGIVHRLDKDTSGLMLAAKTDFAAESLRNQIRNKSAKRKYLAIALGEFSQTEGTIDKPLVHYMDSTVKMQIAPDGEGKPALTHYRVLEQFRGAALVELELKTGRTHQIRVHLKSINHPLFGDNLYGAKGSLIEKYRGIKVQGQILQSYYLSFTHPKNNEIMTFELEPKDWDKDLVRVLKIMRGA